MPRQLAPTIVLLLIALLLPPMTGARALAADPADSLPSGASILRMVQGDVDGDGADEVVMLYALQAVPPAPRAGLLVLRATADDDAVATHLFGEPPGGMRGEPVLDPRGTVDLELRDLTGDGVADIVLTVRNQFQEPTPRTLLWVFGHGEGPPTPPSNPHGPMAPPWTGTGFRLEAFLEGGSIEIEGVAGAGGATLRRRATVDALRGPEPAVQVEEAYTWQDDGFRLATRALTLPPAAEGSARAAETAVLSFYAAIGRNDIQSAVSYLGDDLRASRSANAVQNPDASSPVLRVEEIRTLDPYTDDAARAGAEREVYVRVSLVDPGPGAPGASADGQPRTQRHTDAGIWRVRRDGDVWRLMAGTLHQTANLEQVSAALSPGMTIVETMSGDLRRTGSDDLVVLAAPPGRFALLEPYVIFGRTDGAGGLEPAVPLAAYLPDELAGATNGSVRIDDVNRDGTPEITFSAVVGAHSSQLWVVQWDGSTMAPLFAGVSNVPAGGIRDLDHDGSLEIIQVQSGYCGSYASSPVMPFTLQWQDGAYRAASRRFPNAHDDAVGRALEYLALPATLSEQERAARACVQHLLATALTLRGHGSEARVAYQAYSELRRSLPGADALPTRPIYLGLPYVEDDLRSVLAAVEAGEYPGWDAPERAILHDLLADALITQAREAQFRADDAVRRGDAEAARAAHRRASEARQAATREYQAALTLDPTDEEARRALGE